MLYPKHTLPTNYRKVTENITIWIDRGCHCALSLDPSAGDAGAARRIRRRIFCSPKIRQKIFGYLNAMEKTCILKYVTENTALSKKVDLILYLVIAILEFRTLRGYLSFPKLLNFLQEKIPENFGIPLTRLISLETACPDEQTGQTVFPALFSQQQKLYRLQLRLDY